MSSTSIDARSWILSISFYKLSKSCFSYVVFRTYWVSTFSSTAAALDASQVLTLNLVLVSDSVWVSSSTQLFSDAISTTLTFCYCSSYVLAIYISWNLPLRSINSWFTSFNQSRSSSYHCFHYSRASFSTTSDSVSVLFMSIICHFWTSIVQM